jgi:predicted O-linked N-acetylglucosamine transferase (SPINDLY family)
VNREQRRAAKSLGKAPPPTSARPAGSTRPIAEQFAAAFAHHQAGRLAEAETLYRQICAIDPRHVESLHFLGVIAGQAGRNDIAIELIGKALAIAPDHAEAHYNLGHALARENRPDQAAAHYQRVLAIRPRAAEVHYSLGLVLLGQGKSTQATACFEQALALKPTYHEAHHNLGYMLKEQGRLEEAARRYERALALKPDFAEAHNGLGAVLLLQSRLAEATACCERALALRPDFAQAHCNLGGVFAQQGRLDEATACFERALALMPGFSEAHCNLGGVFTRQGRLDQAMACFERALALKPDFAEALTGRGIALRDLRRPAEALASFEHALALKPDYADALNNRGLALRDLRRSAEALASFEATLAIRPDDVDALHNRGIAFRDLGLAAEALASFDAALAIKPDNGDFLCSRGIALRDLQRPAAALVSFDKAIAIKPDHQLAFGGMAEAALAACDWARTATLAGEVKARIAQPGASIAPFTLLGYGSDPLLQLGCAKKSIRDKVPVPAQPLWTGAIYRHDKVRIAYLSADFRRHAVSLLMAELFELHDRAHFEVLGISFGLDDQSSTRARVMRAFDQFHDVRSKSDLDVAKLLNDLQVDIAIDLNGHTHGARPGILAHRPAPVQASYLGYPGTMGADFIDYLIADKTVLPFDQQPFYTEKIVHLPDCYWVTDSKLEIAARTPTRREVGLPDEGFVFCCFNNNYKVAASIFDVWMRLLGAVEGSVLWLLPTNGDAEASLRREAAARGIDSTRLVFAERLKLDEHLALHRLADLFLDTLPYNAHTTASDALWAGLPLLTCRGASFVGRVATSMLHAVGLPELATDDLDEYEALALRLASDASLLGDFRRRLEQNRSTCPLFDTDRFRRHIESAYTTMWELQQRGESPRSFSVEP